jgi:pimeloyl-ACP methyl ester carboxylesterase
MCRHDPPRGAARDKVAGTTSVGAAKLRETVRGMERRLRVHPDPGVRGLMAAYDLLPRFAADLRVERALGLGQPHVLGLSWGGGLALELYRRHPAVPTSLVPGLVRHRQRRRPDRTPAAHSPAPRP